MSRLAAHPLFVPLLIAAIVLACGFGLGSNFYLRVATLVWISALAAIGLNLLMGFAGQVSLGHAGFFGIGAYTTAVAPNVLSISPLLALVLGLVLSAAIAFLVGRPILKLKGHYLAVATLGFGILVSMVLTNESGLTGGPDGMTVARPELFGLRIRGVDHWYWISGAVLVLGAWLAGNLVRSPTGRALRALHDSEVAARVVGVDVARYKVVAFVVSAVYTALAGGMLALFNGFITPDVAGFLHSIEFVVMVVLGGLGSIFGSVVGAAILIALPQALSAFQEYEHLALGFVLMAFMIFLRKGIVPSLVALVWRGSK
ncbi:branched-chain amino acid ABC transporter permease [Amorphus orientalis]|uniref:Branched-chain amino acid transport system permease protein n=1 Tax=Amorphus orientalis TaxID=649198 RepID=A0AAE4ASC0_9HYPH|nr:branched-chain amino acid ABC transporter permease [Amorphus orientalis]MDQ0316091.1 branched-chain amino acid transport system permease protein [Amorphus orientalis]